MRVACVLVTHLEAKVEMSRHPHLEDRPVLIVDRDPSRSRPVVVDRFRAASGVAAGMTLEQAVSRHANAVVLDADRTHYRRVFGRVLASLQGVSDRVEEAELGTAYVRIDGLEGMYRGEAGSVSALLNAVPAYLAPRIGVAGAKFPAFVAARTAAAHGAFRVPALTPSPSMGEGWACPEPSRRGEGDSVSEDVKAFLAPHAIDLLPVSVDVKGEMHRFGLHTMGAVAAMNRHMLTDRFGPEGARAWELCNGIDDSPVIPLAFEESVVEYASLPFHSSSVEALFVAVDALLRRAYARPDMKGRYAGLADLLCAASGWPSWEKSVRFKQPVGSWEKASPVVRSRLEMDRPSTPVEDVTLTLSGFAGESGTQMGLLKDVRDDRRRRLVEADRKLQPLMGGGHALHRIARVAPWHPAPEMRVLQVPIDPSGRDDIRPLHTPRPVEVRESAEGEPVSLRVDRRWQHVSRIDDRWTFDLWWLPEPVTRAYYRVYPDGGGRTTLFHDLEDDRWYRQGA